jgi:hypothetical protein
VQQRFTHAVASITTVQTNFVMLVLDILRLQNKILLKFAISNIKVLGFAIIDSRFPLDKFQKYPVAETLFEAIVWLFLSVRGKKVHAKKL